MSTSFPKIPHQTLLLHWNKGADEVNRRDTNTTRGAVADGMQALRGDLCSRGREQGGVSPRLDWTEPDIRALFRSNGDTERMHLNGLSVPPVQLA